MLIRFVFVAKSILPRNLVSLPSSKHVGAFHVLKPPIWISQGCFNLRFFRRYCRGSGASASLNRFPAKPSNAEILSAFELDRISSRLSSGFALPYLSTATPLSNHHGSSGIALDPRENEYLFFELARRITTPSQCTLRAL